MNDTNTTKVTVEPHDGGHGIYTSLVTVEDTVVNLDEYHSTHRGAPHNFDTVNIHPAREAEVAVSAPRRGSTTCVRVGDVTLFLTTSQANSLFGQLGEALRAHVDAYR